MCVNILTFLILINDRHICQSGGEVFLLTRKCLVFQLRIKLSAVLIIFSTKCLLLRWLNFKKNGVCWPCNKNISLFCTFLPPYPCYCETIAVADQRQKIWSDIYFAKTFWAVRVCVQKPSFAANLLFCGFNSWQLQVDNASLSWKCQVFSIDD